MMNSPSSNQTTGNGGALSTPDLARNCAPSMTPEQEDDAVSQLVGKMSKEEQMHS